MYVLTAKLFIDVRYPSRFCRKNDADFGQWSKARLRLPKNLQPNQEILPRECRMHVYVVYSRLLQNTWQ